MPVFFLNFRFSPGECSSRGDKISEKGELCGGGWICPRQNVLHLVACPSRPLGALEASTGHSGGSGLTIKHNNHRPTD